jgi:hypothetical protein
MAIYYQYFKFPPTYPIKYANWIGLGWIIAGVILAIYVTVRYPDRARDMERVYVEDEAVTGVPTPA